MVKDILKPEKDAVFYEDKQVYAALASYPLAPGHAVVVWKKKVSDIHLLKRKEYLYLMDAVERVRNALRKALKINKVYVMYLDEVNHVHWHLVPAKNHEGTHIFDAQPKKLRDFSLASKLRLLF